MIFILALCVFAGCKRSPDTNENKLSATDINDQTMSADLRKVFAERRQRLTPKIGNGVVLVRSGYGYDGGRHEFRAVNNFYYLTGLNQHGFVLALSANGLYPYTLYMKEKSIYDVIYTGAVPEKKVMMDTFGPDTLLPVQELGKAMENILRSGTPLYIDFEDNFLKDSIRNIITRLKASDTLIRDIAPLTDEMRVNKDELEIERIRTAVEITGEAFIHACRVSHPGMYEFETEASIEYIFRKKGSSMPAFESIICSGPNTVILHYTSNDRKMQDGDLLLMDIGAEYGHYGADVTRTIPVNGKFTREQRDIYELVLKAQKAAIAQMLPGRFLVEGHNRSVDVMARGLYELGLLTDTASTWQKKFYTLYPISHFLGMDVHDVGDYRAPYADFRKYIAADTCFGRKLEKGMVLTVEPGLYFRSNGLAQLFDLAGKEASREEIQKFLDEVAPAYEKYENMGVRIEDDVLITDNGNIVLSGNIPKETDEIEKIMNRRNR